MAFVSSHSLLRLYLLRVFFSTVFANLIHSHCHIAWHLSGGLYMNLLIDPDAITPFPSVVDDTCSAWYAWEKNHLVDEIDSGL